jgi:hypothetical protein
MLSLAAAVCACQPAPLPLTPDPAPRSSSPGPVEGPAARALPSASASSWSVVPLSVPPTAEEFLATFRPMQVAHDAPIPRVLYSWTTREQAEALRRNRRLLVKGAEDPTVSVYDASLWEVYSKDRLARLLFNPPFLLHRYAWPHAWGTRLGGDETSYGDELIRMTLKEDALIAAFLPHAPAAARWTVFDLQGRRLPEAEALKKASKIAAVYHVHKATGSEASFREFIVCNETMVASWALATDDIRAQLVRERAALSLWRRAQSDARPGIPPEGFPHWTGDLPGAAWASAPQRGAEAIYESALAFASKRYQPTTTVAEELLASLGALKIEGAPLEHRPDLPELRLGALPPPLLSLPPKRICVRGTMVGEVNCYMEDANLRPCRDERGWVIYCPR